MEKFLTVFIVIAIIGLTTFLILDFQGVFDSSSQEDELVEHIPEEIETSEQNEPLVKEEVVEIEESEEEPEDRITPDDEFIQCLVDSGMVVYASKTCPACTSLARLFGGYERVENLFVICSEERERCNTEMKRTSVPEIQINGELFKGERSLENFAQETGCVF